MCLEGEVCRGVVFKNFKIAKSHVLCHKSVDDYILNSGPAKIEKDYLLVNTNNNPDSNYSKALFYMYGACENLVPPLPNLHGDKQIIVHELLRIQAIWDGSRDEAERCLTD